MYKPNRSVLYIFLLSILTVTYTLAQGACQSLVDEALARSEINCLDLGRNEACYANTLVSAAFVQDVSLDFFTEPTDRAALAEIARINTAPYDPDSEDWGVALMNVQANLPDTLPGQSVTFVLLGDTEVEDGVSPDNVFVPSEGVELIVASNANVRSGPGFNFNIFTFVENGATILADGVDESGNWLRVAANDRVGWVSRNLLEDPDSDVIAALPTLTPDLRTPMQTFYLRTGIGGQACEDAPDVLMIEGPDDIEVDLTVNGANIRVGSTILLRILPPGDILEIIVVDGQVEILDDNYEPTGLIIREGFRAQACLTPPEDLGKDGDDNDRVLGCPFTTPEPVDLGDWCVVDGVLTLTLDDEEQIGCDDIPAIAEELPEVTEAPAPPDNDRDDPIINVESCSSDPSLDPVSNDNANACNAGGSLGGKCRNTDVDQDGDIDQDDINWMFSAGWHLIRWECGLITRDVGDFLDPILPPEITPEPQEEPKPEVTVSCC